MNDCIFCSIAAHELPATFVREDDQVLAIRDVNPQAPVHVLVFPREHIESVAELTPAQDGLWGRMLHVAQSIAQDEGIDESGFRLVDRRLDIDRIMRPQDLAHPVAGAVADVTPAACFPLVGVAAIAQLGIDELCFHKGQGLLAAQVMPRALDRGADALKR